jgi:hypothetical protein
MSLPTLASSTEGGSMRSWKRFWRADDEEAKEIPCPRCGVPVPLNAVTCTACGWDPHEKYEHARADAER